MARRFFITNLLIAGISAAAFPAVTPVPRVQERQVRSGINGRSVLWTASETSFTISYDSLTYAVSGTTYTVTTSDNYWAVAATGVTSRSFATTCRNGTLSGANSYVLTCASTLPLCATDYLFYSIGDSQRWTRPACGGTTDSNSLIASYFLVSPVISSTTSSSIIPSPSPPPPPPPDGTPVGAIVGGVVGGLAVLVIAILAVFFILRRRKRKQLRNQPIAADISTVTSGGAGGIASPTPMKHYEHSPSVAASSTVDGKHTSYASSYPASSPPPPQYFQPQPNYALGAGGISQHQQPQSAMSTSPISSAGDGFGAPYGYGSGTHFPPPGTSPSPAGAGAGVPQSAASDATELPAHRFASPVASNPAELYSESSFR